MYMYIYESLNPFTAHLKLYIIANWLYSNVKNFGVKKINLEDELNTEKKKNAEKCHYV